MSNSTSTAWVGYGINGLKQRDVRVHLKSLLILGAAESNIQWIIYSIPLKTLQVSCLDDPNDEEKIIYGVINAVGKSLSAKYRMQQIGNGVGGRDKLEEVFLAFERRGLPLTEQEARRLIVSCEHEFIEAVNNNDQLRPLLRVYPFTEENVKLVIHNCTHDGQDAIRPFIASVGIMSRGKVAYFTGNFASEKYETFAEAVEILAKEKRMKNE